MLCAYIIEKNPYTMPASSIMNAISERMPRIQPLVLLLAKAMSSAEKAIRPIPIKDTHIFVILSIFPILPFIQTALIIPFDELEEKRFTTTNTKKRHNMPYGCRVAFFHAKLIAAAISSSISSMLPGCSHLLRSSLRC